MKRRRVVTTVMILFSFLGLNCGRASEPEFEVGGLYSIKNGDGSFGVAKVLALDPGVVSVRTYKQSYKERPTSIDPLQLSLGTIHDSDGFGMGHLPIA